MVSEAPITHVEILGEFGPEIKVFLIAGVTGSESGYPLILARSVTSDWPNLAEKDVADFGG